MRKKGNYIPWQGDPQLMQETAEMLAGSDTVQAQYIDGQCYLYLASTSKWEKKDAEDRIYHYCRMKYIAIIKTYGCDAEDVFDETMIELFKTGIETYCRRRSSTFEGFFMVTAKKAAYGLRNEKIHNAFYFGHIKNVSEKYNVQICQGNAYRFFQILKLEYPKTKHSLCKIITAIAKQDFETLTSDGDIDRLTRELAGEYLDEYDNYRYNYG